MKRLSLETFKFCIRSPHTVDLKRTSRPVPVVREFSNIWLSGFRFFSFLDSRHFKVSKMQISPKYITPFWSDFQKRFSLYSYTNFCKQNKPCLIWYKKKHVNVLQFNIHKYINWNTTTTHTELSGLKSILVWWQIIQMLKQEILQYLRVHSEFNWIGLHYLLVNYSNY